MGTDADAAPGDAEPAGDSLLYAGGCRSVCEKRRLELLENHCAVPPEAVPHGLLFSAAVLGYPGCLRGELFDSCLPAETALPKVPALPTEFQSLNKKETVG